MEKNPLRHPAQAVAAGSLSLLRKAERHFAGNTSPAENTFHANTPDFDAALQSAGIACGEYECTTGLIRWPPTIQNFPGLHEIPNPSTIPEYLRHYSLPDAKLALKALDTAIGRNIRTEIVISAENTSHNSTLHRLTFTPRLAANSSAKKVLCLLQDISETKILSQETEHHLNTSTLIAESAKDVLFRVMLPEVTYEYISQAVQTVTGYPPHVWYRNPYLLLDLIPPAWQSKFKRVLKRFLDSGSPEEFTFPIIHQRGDVRWIQVRTSFVRNETGEILAIEGIASDITDKMRQEMERNQLIRELQKALADVKVLSGLLPICSFCKKVRDDQGYWKQIESYITEHSELFFTHGLCPDCLTYHYPEYLPPHSAAARDPEF